MSDTPSESEPPLAPADSLHGQLQRGRGRGFLRALEAEPATVHALLLDCITHDPRWDRQIEDREDYYARLAIATQMSVAPLAAYVRTVEDDRLGWATFLTIETLGALARLGDAEAVEILRAYIGYGPKWDAALRKLAELPDPAATAGLADMLCVRFQTGQQMNDSSVYGIFGGELDSLWQSWHRSHPCMARLLDEIQAIWSTYQWNPPANYDAFSLDELLTIVNGRNRRHIENFLLSRLQHADVDQYVATFSTDNPFAWAVAFECLAAMKRVASFYDMLLDRLVSYLESTNEKAVRGAKLSCISRMICRLPPERTLPFARRWLDSSEWYLRVVADDILEEHATPDDIPRVRAALTRALNNATRDNTEHYRICSALDVLSRFPDIGLLPEVETAYLQVDYAYARMRAARAMRANAPAFFAETYAYECLWDCEEETRQIGCETAPLAIPGARERLQALRDDPGEGAELREVAAGRLTSEE